MAKKPKQVEYTDPEGQVQTGWYADGHVYTDEAATQPIPEGSTFRTGSGNVYRMTHYGGVLRASAKQEDADGAWIPQGNQWYRQAEDLTQELEQREPFAYDPNDDPLWRSEREQAQLAGSRAMQDAMGRAAALTGGYGSTYAQAAGQQAYALELQKLSELLPELYDRAKGDYDAETKQLLTRLGEVTGLYDRDYQTYLDKIAARNSERALDRALQSEAWEHDMQQQKLSQEQAQFEQEQALAQQKLSQEQAAQAQKLAQERQDKQIAQQSSERDRAFSQAMQGLTLGVRVPDALLEQAGIDKAYAERLRQYYAARQQ